MGATCSNGVCKATKLQDEQCVYLSESRDKQNIEENEYLNYIIPEGDNLNENNQYCNLIKEFYCSLEDVDFKKEMVYYIKVEQN